MSTVKRDLRACNFRSLVRRKVPTADPVVHRKRLAFAKTWLRKSNLNVVFSDEHWVSTNDHSSRRQWVTHRSQLVPRERKRLHNIPRAQVWACVGTNYKSPIVIFPGNVRLNNESYKRKCLRLVLPSIQGQTFQQDGARPHVHSSIKPYIEHRGVSLMEDWPPYSPDLNIIEEVWPLLNERISAQKPKTLDDLQRAIVTGWNSISQTTINKFVGSFRTKLERCVKSGGSCL